MERLSRRDFARSAGLATALSYSRILGANDRVRMGYIGVGNRGDQVHDAFLEHGDQQTVAVCDLRDDYMDFAIKKSRATPKKYHDYKKLLDDKDVDAVVVATPDHWHALMFVDACHAGKDVYVEKPLSLTVAEGRQMVESARHTNTRDAGGHPPPLGGVLQGGGGVRALGRHRPGDGGARLPHHESSGRNGIGNPAGQRPAERGEWDQWLGPAPKVPYNKNRTFYNFRWFYDYSGGQLTNFGVHYMDMMRWCLGKEAPQGVVAMGGKYAVKDNREIPDTLEVIWDFDGTLVMFAQYNANSAPGNSMPGSEMELRGTKGTMYISRRASWEVVPEKVTDWTSDARTPLDRVTEKAYNPSKKAGHAAEEDGRQPGYGLPRAQFSGLREEPRALQLRYRDRPPVDLGHADRQHRA